MIRKTGVGGHRDALRAPVQRATAIFLITRGKSQIGIACSEIPRENGKPARSGDNSYDFEQKYTRMVSYLLAFLTNA